MPKIDLSEEEVMVLRDFITRELDAAGDGEEMDLFTHHYLNELLSRELGGLGIMDNDDPLVVEFYKKYSECESCSDSFLKTEHPTLCEECR